MNQINQSVNSKNLPNQLEALNKIGIIYDNLPKLEINLRNNKVYLHEMSSPIMSISDGHRKHIVFAVQGKIDYQFQVNNKNIKISDLVGTVILYLIHDSSEESYAVVNPIDILEAYESYSKKYDTVDLLLINNKIKIQYLQKFIYNKDPLFRLKY